MVSPDVHEVIPAEVASLWTLAMSPNAAVRLTPEQALQLLCEDPDMGVTTTSPGECW